MHHIVFCAFSIIFSCFLCAACKNADEMTQDYNEKFSSTHSSDSVTVTEDYEPGVYKLAALIPDAEYSVDITMTRQVQAKTGYTNYSWWLQSASGSLLGSATFDSDGDRVYTGGITAQSNYVNILTSVTGQVTTEYRTENGLTDSQISTRQNTAHILRCHAFNDMGDEYWDTALLYVVPKSDEDEED